MKHALVKRAGIALLAAAALTLSACAAEPAETGAAAPAESGTACAGVRVVVDFGELGADAVEACADTDEAITAVEAFAAAGVELSESTAYAGAICRVDGLPAADEVLGYGSETTTEDCASMPQMWAYWGLFVDLGDGWEYAQEGAATQSLEPAQAVSFAWQFGDTSEPRLPEA